MAGSVVNIIGFCNKGEQSIGEIGRIMGITSNAAKVKLHRARLRLKQKLEIYFTNELKEIRQ